MDYSFLPNGDLIFWMYDEELLAELSAQVEENECGLNAILWDWWEWLICNTEIDWIRPEEIGALTDSPILGFVGRDDEGEIDYLTDVWWYPNYMISGPETDLARHGYCIWEYAGDD